MNDLYTDPTVHTWTGTEFGDNNLGLRGMALFLYSHTCSPLCQKLGLPAFDLWGSDTPTQHRAPKLAMMRATTMYVLVTTYMFVAPFSFRGAAILRFFTLIVAQDELLYRDCEQDEGDDGRRIFDRPAS